MKSKTSKALEFAKQSEVMAIGLTPGSAIQLWHKENAKVLRNLDDAFNNLKAQKSSVKTPIKWEYRVLDTHPDTATSGEYSDWKELRPKGLQSMDDAVKEMRHYIASGHKYQIRPLFAGDVEGL